MYRAIRIVSVGGYSLEKRNLKTSVFRIILFLLNRIKLFMVLKHTKWRCIWIGHTLRKPTNSITRSALQWNPQGKRRVGRPRNTWKRNTTHEMEKLGYKWHDQTRLAQNRTEWRSIVGGQCSASVQRA